MRQRDLYPCRVFGLLTLALLVPAVVSGTGNGSSIIDRSVPIGDPISAGSGEYYFRLPLLDLGGPLPLRYELSYRLRLETSGAFGLSSFDHNVPIVAITGSDLAEIFSFRGDSVVGFVKEGGIWILGDNTPIIYQLRETGADSDHGYFYLLDPVEERVYIFEKISGWGERLRWLMDRNGNTLTYSYPSAIFRYPTGIADGLGRSLELTYPSGPVGTVTDHGGRQLTMTYEQNHLTAVTDPLGGVTAFTYDADWLITALTRPAGNTPYVQVYGPRMLNGAEELRAISQTDADGSTTSLDYDAAGNLVTETRADGSTAAYRHYAEAGVPASVTDPAGNVAAVSQTPRQQISALTDRTGASTEVTYHPESGKLASVTNALGQVVAYTYSSSDQTFTNADTGEQVTFTFYDLVRVDLPDGTQETYTYDARGNPLTRVDPAGETWTYAYNGRGQVLTETNPAGGVSTYTYRADGTLASSTDSDLGTTTYGYDALKRLTAVNHPGGAVSTLAWDAAGRLTALTDENGSTTAFTYDANGNLTALEDPTGAFTGYAYDAMDRLSGVTDRLGQATTLAYDPMGRLASTTDPNAVVTTFGYDLRGWPNATTLGGATWETAYSDEGVVTSRVTPQGHLSERHLDALGNLTGVTNPAGETSSLLRDPMNRIARVTDPLLQSVDFAYEDRGLPAAVTAPVVGTVAYAYDVLGLLDSVTDANGSEWHLDYTAAGRRQSWTDPLGNVRQWAYDERGRVSQITDPGGGTETVTYDAAGNVTRRLYSDGTDLHYTYDAVNRLVGTGGLDLTLDAEGRATATIEAGVSFGATYDAGGRLVTATYADGAFTVTYEYDAATGLLSRVSDDLTGTQVELAYDADRRLVGIARPNGVDATFTWDAAGRRTRLQEGTVVDLLYTYDAAGRLIQAQTSAPLDPADFAASATEVHSYDAASQLSSGGYTYDPRGRLTGSPQRTYAWDAGSRLTAAGGAELTYDGLGFLLTRSAGGATIRFFYNAAIGLQPIVAERDEGSGGFVRYYVWSPAGGLLYMIDVVAGNAVYHYHFDLVGSTLALTDAGGAVSDAYAYTPYGRLIGRQGDSEQIFTFNGYFGVRQEGPDGSLYHMRARYYDARTARFLSREPLWPQIADARMINPYQFAVQDPLRRVDVTGRFLGSVVDALKAQIRKSISDFWTHVRSVGDSLRRWDLLESATMLYLGTDQRVHTEGVAMGNWMDHIANHEGWWQIQEAHYRYGLNQALREGRRYHRLRQLAWEEQRRRQNRNAQQSAARRRVESARFSRPAEYLMGGVRIVGGVGGPPHSSLVQSHLMAELRLVGSLRDPADGTQQSIVDITSQGETTPLGRNLSTVKLLLPNLRDH